jgi:type VI protein secretion system component VasF
LPKKQRAGWHLTSYPDFVRRRARAERNQRRKLAFIPVWPVVAALALVLIIVLVAW